MGVPHSETHEILQTSIPHGGLLIDRIQRGSIACTREAALVAELPYRIEALELRARFPR